MMSAGGCCHPVVSWLAAPAAKVVINRKAAASAVS
jgi:hypothetical protein